MNPSYILAGLSIALFLFCGIKLLLRRFAPVRKVRAKVADKFRQEVFSKYSGNGKAYRYSIVFLANGKKLSFYVSELTYNGYRKGETGTLTYQGSRLIDFH